MRGGAAFSIGQPQSTERGGMEEVWSRYGAGMEGLPCGSRNYLILSNLKGKGCVQVLPSLLLKFGVCMRNLLFHNTLQIMAN